MDKGRSSGLHRSDLRRPQERPTFLDGHASAEAGEDSFRVRPAIEWLEEGQATSSAPALDEILAQVERLKLGGDDCENKEGRYPALLTYGPYAKGLAFQDGYPSAWQRMVEEHPNVAAGSTNKYQNWEVVDPEKWVPEDYVCVRVDSRGCGCSPGYIDHFSPRETLDYYQCIEWAGKAPWSNGKVGLNGISYYGNSINGL